MSCAVCGQTSTVPLWPITSNADGDLDGSWWIHRCDTCGSGLTVPVPDAEALGRYYAAGVYEKRGGRGFLLQRALDVLLNARLNEIARLRRPPGLLLDVGCGKGRFLARAAGRGWRAVGLERTHAQARVARASAPGVAVVEGDLSTSALRDDSFDAATAWHVLEHLPDPGSALEAMFRLLRSGGVLACEVPNFASWQARLWGPSWFQLDVPRHLVHFTPPSLRGLVEAHGFRVERVRTLSLDLGPFGMLQSALTAAGFPPSLLFRWLKRSTDAPPAIAVAGCLGAAALAVIPSLVSEAAAALFGHGGVIRVLAVRP